MSDEPTAPRDGDDVDVAALAELAEDLVERLEGLKHEVARVRAAHGRRLIATFRSWTVAPPTPAHRERAVAALRELYLSCSDLNKGSR